MKNYKKNVLKFIKHANYFFFMKFKSYTSVFIGKID